LISIINHFFMYKYIEKENVIIVDCIRMFLPEIMISDA
jgi:hypothetical protein